MTTPGFLNDGAGCASATLYASIAIANARVLGFGATPRLSLASATSIEAHDGTNSATRAASSVVARSASLGIRWTGSTLTSYADGSTTDGTYDGAMLGATVALGSDTSGTNPVTGWLKSIKFAKQPGACP